MTDKEIEQYIFDIIYCSALSEHALNPKWDKELKDEIIGAIKYINKNKELK